MKSHFFIITLVSLPLVLLTPQIVGLAQAQPLEKYQNNNLGFTIDYPSGWGIHEADLSEDIKEQEIMKPWESLLHDVTFSASEVTIEGVGEGNPRTPAYLQIQVFEPREEEYLDPSDMKIKSRTTPIFTSRDLAEGWITYNTNFWGGLFEKVRENATVFGVGKYPALRVDAMNHGGDTPYYDSIIYSVYNGKIYGIQAHMAGLAVPEYLPVIQKMIDSFHIIEVSASLENETPSLDCEKNPDAVECQQGDEEDGGEERNVEDEDTSNEDGEDNGEDEEG
jgi:hypothetical protein